MALTVGWCWCVDGCVFPNRYAIHSVPSMLTESETQALIDAAEQYAETKGGWTTARHASYATTDVPVTALSSDVQRSGLSLTAAH